MFDQAGLPHTARSDQRHVPAVITFYLLLIYRYTNYATIFMITKYHLIELKETVQTETIIKCILIWLLQITFHTVIVISTMQRIIYHHSH